MQVEKANEDMSALKIDSQKKDPEGERIEVEKEKEKENNND